MSNVLLVGWILLVVGASTSLVTAVLAIVGRKSSSANQPETAEDM